jgi:glutamate synthase domain-containing protein 2
MPLREALAFVDDALTGFGLRDEIRIIAAGKVFTGFHLARNFALGADIINSARGMMMALGCVQSLSCHTNTCPTGVATQDPKLIHGLVVPDKAERVYRFHKSTIHALTDLISSTGLRSPGELTRSHIFRRVDQQRILRYDEIFPPVQPGALLRPDYAGPYAELLTTSRADRFI